MKEVNQIEFYTLLIKNISENNYWTITNPM